MRANHRRMMTTTGFRGKKERLFIAIVPDGPILDGIMSRVAALKREPWARGVRWLPGENIHLTLRFLGDTEEDRFLRLRESLRLLTKRCHGFEIRLSRVLFLPSAARARVIAVETEPCSGLEQLAASVETAVTACGFEPEKRRFKAHITVGRCRDMDMRTVPVIQDFKGISFSVGAFELMKSTLSEKGATYHSLDTVGLASD